MIEVVLENRTGVLRENTPKRWCSEFLPRFTKSMRRSSPGFVTNLKIGRHEALDDIGSRSDGYSLSPLTKSIVSSVAMLGCGDHVVAAA
jgi:hypothetical protein